MFHGDSGVNVSPPLPALWPGVTAVSGSVRAVPTVRVACDVDNPVFGPRGAAAVYGPQKGLRAPDVPRFEVAAQRLAREVCRHLGADTRHFDTPGAGAAGGIAFGLLVGAGARLVPGSALVAAWLGLEARARAADWVLTGEGRFDESSWAGKGPGALLALARAAGRRCAVFAGSVAPGLSAKGDEPRPELIAISPPREPLSRSLPRTRENLEQAVTRWLARIGD
jgi:glycerate kinase